MGGNAVKDAEKMCRHRVQGFFKWIPLNELMIDPDYQRGEVSHLVQKMAKDFVDGYCPPLVVAPKRNGKYPVVDGGQRLRAMRELENIDEAHCWVLPVDSQEMEADCFVGIATQSQNLSWNQRFISLCASGDQKALAMQGVLEKHNVDVRKGTSKSQKINSMSRPYQSMTPTEFDKVLTFVNTHWPDEPKRLSGYMLYAVLKFSRELKKQLDRELLGREVMQRFASLTWAEVYEKFVEARGLKSCGRETTAFIAFALLWNCRRLDKNSINIVLS